MKGFQGSEMGAEAQSFQEQLLCHENDRRFSEELLDLLPLPVFYEDERGRYMLCNKAFCDFMAKDEADILHKTVVEVSVAPEAAMSSFLSDRRMMMGGLASEVVERVMQRGDGALRNVIIYKKSLLSPVGKKKGIIGVLLDVTDLKKAQAREEFYREKLVALASAFAAAKEQERCRIARDIHDSISQNLALSKIQLKMLESRLEDAGLRDELRKTISILDDSLQYTRELTFDLGVPVLYQLGLDAAFQWLASELARKFSFTVNYRAASLPRELPDNLKALIFRSAQELLMNAVKHSGEREASLDVRVEGPHIVVRVSDKGKGFDVDALSQSFLSPHSYGLFQLETLVRSLGGKVLLHSEKGRGADVSLEIPLVVPIDAPERGRPFKSAFE